MENVASTWVPAGCEGEGATESVPGPFSNERMLAHPLVIVQ